MSLKITSKSDDLYDKLMCGSISGRKQDCRFKSPSKDRYCLATSHTSCGKCRFFKPTSQAKLNLFSEKIEYLTKETAIRIGECKRLRDTLDIVRATNKQLQKENEYLTEQNENLIKMLRERK